MLETEQLTKKFKDTIAVDDVSLVLRQGESVGLLGPNGAGKSTMLHMLSGFLQPSAGELRVFGESAWENPGMYRRIGLVRARL